MLCGVERARLNLDPASLRFAFGWGLRKERSGTNDSASAAAWSEKYGANRVEKLGGRELWPKAGPAVVGFGPKTGRVLPWRQIASAGVFPGFYPDA